MRLTKGSGGYENKRSEFRMEARAIRERWPIPPAARVNLLRRVLEVLRDEKSTKRDKIAAARVIIQADGLNLDAQRIELLKQATEPDSVARILEDALRRAEGIDRGQLGEDPPEEPG